ncbi:MAG: AgmX/PglI C-terminal domain-containing protein [Pseudomonadota bacterium]
MKFFCQKCQTKYAIADEKVRGKILKIRCKKCQAIIVVRESDAVDRAEAPRTPVAGRVSAPARTQPARSAAAQVSRAASPRATAPAPRPSHQRPVASARQDRNDDDDRDDSTRVTGPGEMSALLSDLHAATAAQPAPRPRKAEPDLLLWYMAFKGQQSQPMTREEISARIRSGEVSPRAYGWNQTLPEWKRLADLPEFKDDFKARKAPQQGAQVVDFRQKMAERKRADAGVHRARAIEALDQIADLVRQAPEEPPATSAPPPRPTAPATPASKAVAPPAAADAPAPAVAAATSSTPGLEPLGAPATRSAAMEDLFFDPASIQTFSGMPGVPKDDIENLGDGFAGQHSPDAFDPFSAVPDAMPADEPRKESTRVFMAAAGLQNRARKHRIYAVVGIAAGLGLVITIGLDAFEVIKIPLLHGYVQSVKVAVSDEPRTIEPVYAEDHVPLTEDEKLVIQKALLEGNMAQVEAVRRQAKNRAARSPRDPNTKIDLSDDLRGGGTDGTSTDPNRRGSGAAQAVALSDEEKKAMQDLAERADMPQVQIAVKPGIGEIKLPRVSTGGLDEKQVSDVVRENQKGVQECVSREAKYGVKLPPALHVAATIETNGTVSRARVIETVPGMNKFCTCLGQRVRSWKFPAFSGAAMDVEIPFKFTTVQ